jgi:class 3 adenylate cyclase/tetratricopeptide (TPR) repeat protein
MECGASLDPEARPAAAAPVSERRLTSVVFGDLVGFTTLSEGRDPEEVRELLSRYFAEARLIVERYGGTVEKFIGDAVMAVWGVPVAHEDDAERAVRAGLELVEAVPVLGADIGMPDLAMRVGVVTGEVAVTVGATGQGMVAGDAVNTASRIQSAAQPGTVWVDHPTRQLTVASVSYRAVGEHLLKGKAEPLELYEAVSVVASLGGADRIDGLDSALVARHRDLRLVKELFHATEESGRPTLLVVQGEAGVGKSRLAWEFEKYIDGLTATVRWHRGRCLSYGEGVAFWALSEAVRVRLGLVDADMGPVPLDQLEDALVPWVPDEAERAWLRPRMATLVGTESSEPTTREELFSAWVTFFERVSDGEPVVLVIDDAQYADAALLDFLEHLLAISRFPMFILLLARSGLVERRSSLATARRTTVLHLEPLGDTDMGTLVDGLVEGLPTSVRDQLVERSEGIPLFAVETVRSLIDRDLVVPSEGRYVLADGASADLTSLGAPASLQALVAARLDALSPEERRVVSDASVLGLSFTVEGITALTAGQVDLEAVLDSLVGKQILSLQADRFSAEFGQYRFVQTVVRQVAYEMLSRRDRKARHLAVAAQLEASADSSDDVAGVIAQHYLDAVDNSSETDSDVPELTTKATELLERAAVRARAVGANAEATRYLERAIERVDNPVALARMGELTARTLLDSGRADEAHQRATWCTEAYEQLHDEDGRLRTIALQGRSLIAQGRNQDAFVLVRPVWESSVETPETLRGLLDIGQVVTSAATGLADHEATMASLDRRVLMAEGMGDETELANVVAAMGVVYWSRGAPFVGRELLLSAARLAAGNGLAMQASRNNTNLAAITLPRNVEEALEYSRAALDGAHKAGIINYIGIATANLALGLWTAGHWQDLDALHARAGEQVFDVSDGVIIAITQMMFAAATGRSAPPASVLEVALDDQAMLAWLAHGRMLVALADDDLETAVAEGATSIVHSHAATGLGDDFMHFWPPAILTALRAGRLDEAERLFAVVADSPPGLVLPALAAQLPRLRALIADARGGDPEQVEADLRASIEALQAYGARPEVARTQEDLGRWLLKQGRHDEAIELLDAARRTYEELGAAGWLARLDQTQPVGG